MAVGAGQQSKRRTRRPEQAFQASLVKSLRMIVPREVMVFAVPNGGWRSAAEGAIFIGQGVVPGMPDLMILHDGRAFGLELKAGKGKTSDAQERAHEALGRALIPVAVVRRLDEALDFLRLHRIPTRLGMAGA